MASCRDEDGATWSSLSGISTDIKKEPPEHTSGPDVELWQLKQAERFSGVLYLRMNQEGLIT